MPVNILHKQINQNLLYFNEQDNSPTLGREDALQRLDKETLQQIINPLRDYEMVRYEHKKYNYNNGSRTYQRNDIYLCFYFYDETEADWLNDYKSIGLDHHHNLSITKETTQSFFKLEFFDTPDPDSQKLLFSKLYPVPFGNRTYDDTLKEYLFIPSFHGNSIENTENFFLFWFQNNPQYTGSTFYVTAKFYNTLDGKVLSFLNKEKQNLSTGFNQIEDRYYLCEIDKNDFTYTYYAYDGTKGSRVGSGPDNCILFSQVSYS